MYISIHSARETVYYTCIITYGFIRRLGNSSIKDYGPQVNGWLGYIIAGCRRPDTNHNDPYTYSPYQWLYVLQTTWGEGRRVDLNFSQVDYNSLL